MIKIKVSKTNHIRKTGPGKGKLRKNPSRGKFKDISKEKVYHTMFKQDKKTGLLKGRARVEGKGDGTGLIREGGAGRIIGRVSKSRKKYTKELDKVRYG